MTPASASAPTAAPGRSGGTCARPIASWLRPDARPGDILLFDSRGVAPAPECADRAGIVESVGAGGRITFVEARDGRVRRSFVDPAHPSSRRDARGEILNSFLRPIRIDDPPGARYFAGEMLCGVARTR